MTLDRMLRGLDGLEVVGALRRAGVATPVLVISALGDVDERITGLRAEGNDSEIEAHARRSGLRAVAAFTSGS